MNTEVYRVWMRGWGGFDCLDDEFETRQEAVAFARARKAECPAARITIEVETFVEGWEE